jgi:hypothetical protein
MSFGNTMLLLTNDVLDVIVEATQGDGVKLGGELDRKECCSLGDDVSCEVR